VFTAAILTFFFAWNEFVLAISLTSTTTGGATGTGSRTVPAQLSYFVGPDPFNPPYGQLATASVIVDPDHHHRPVVPAKDRRGPDLRRSEGLRHGSH